MPGIIARLAQVGEPYLNADGMLCAYCPGGDKRVTLDGQEVEFMPLQRWATLQRESWETDMSHLLTQRQAQNLLGIDAILWNAKVKYFGRFFSPNPFQEIAPGADPNSLLSHQADRPFEDFLLFAGNWYDANGRWKGDWRQLEQRYEQHLQSVRLALTVVGTAKVLGDTSYQGHTIGCEQSGDSYSVSCAIPQHAYRYQGQYYLFSPGTASMRVRVQGSRVMLSPPAMPIGYTHPFVFSTGSICFRGQDGDRWVTLKIPMEQFQPIASGVADHIGRALYEARANLLSGYNRNPHPVNKLPTLSASITPLRPNCPIWECE